jgi:acyl-CoA hydrolase
MATSAMRGLAESGALRDGDAHHAGLVIGDAALHDWLARSSPIEMVPVTRSHDRAGLARLPAFTAINSALEVDLFGQANLEWRAGKQMSGVGGAPDFVQAALASPGGRSITALPATAGGGAVSRIVARLDAPTISIPRGDIDTVVTEYGVAELRELSIGERARALIEIAAPAHRDMLRAQWRAMQQ